MQPVEPSTIVRGPAAFTISFMISADSHPWQVRWPDVKYSSIVTFLMPRKGSRTWVALANVSAMAWSPLFAHAEPVRLGVGLPGIRGSETEVGRLIDVLQGHLTAAEAGDEAEERRPLLGVVHRRPDFVGDDPGRERRAERIIAVDDPDGLGLGQRGHQSVRREGPEPAKAHEPDLLALRPHVADAHLDRQRDLAHAGQDDLGVVRHVLLEPRIVRAAAEDPTEVGVGLLDDGVGALHGLVVLATDLDDPVFVGLRGHRNRVAGMHLQAAPAVPWQG